MANPTHKLCPDCGATIAASCEQCWLCQRRLAAAEQIARHAAGSTDAGARTGPTDGLRIVQFTIMVLAGMAMGPAAMAAFFAVCHYDPSKNRFDHYPSPDMLPGAILGGIGTIAVLLGVVIVLAYQIRRPRR
jgi:hypothetical protein